jgi:hypothetical protein
VYWYFLEEKMMEPTLYVLYDGESEDGMGHPKYYKRTTDKQEAMEHWKKCKEDPYSIGEVVAYTDTKQITIIFDYDWKGL